MNLRTKSILETAIKEYIQSGNPVSSKELAEKYDFGIKWAAIRRELGVLTKEGFLAQPHTSGGRVPTDKGYQFFVGNTLGSVMASRQILKDNYGLLADNLKHGQLKNFVEEFAEEVKMLGVGQSVRKNREAETQVYKFGLNDLFAKLDLGTKKEFQEIAEDFERLDNRIREWSGKAMRSLKAPEVFIGRKSPITKSQNLSVIMDSYDMGSDKILIAVIGPKRMDYNKNINLFRLLRKHLQ